MRLWYNFMSPAFKPMAWSNTKRIYRGSINEKKQRNRCNSCTTVVQREVGYFQVFFGFSSIFFYRVIVMTTKFFLRVEHRMGDILNTHVMGVWPTKKFFWAFEKKFFPHFCYFFMYIRPRWETNISGSDLQKINFFTFDAISRVLLTRWQNFLYQGDALILHHVWDMHMTRL